MISIHVYVSKIIGVHRYLYIYTQVKEPLDRCSAREAAWKKTPITIYSYIYRYIYIHIFMNLTSYRHIAATIS